MRRKNNTGVYLYSLLLGLLALIPMFVAPPLVSAPNTLLVITGIASMLVSVFGMAKCFSIIVKRLQKRAK